MYFGSHLTAPRVPGLHIGPAYAAAGFYARSTDYAAARGRWYPRDELWQGFYYGNELRERHGGR